MKKEIVIGVDVGGTKIRLGIVDKDYVLSNVKTFFSKDVFPENEGIDAFVNLLKEYINEVELDVIIKCICIGLPSTLDKNREVVLTTPNISAINNVALKSVLEKELEKTVYIERDVNYLIRNDIYSSNICTDGIVVGIYLGTGIGNCVLIDGLPLVGKHGVACELGHIPVRANELECVCGNKGCIETIASGKALEKIQKEYYPDSHIKDLFSIHYDTSEYLKEFIHDLSLPIATEINLLDPDVVLIGGGLPMMDAFPKEDLIKYIGIHTRKPLPHDDLDIRFCKADDYSGVRGAGIAGHVNERS